jgi:hypothetical protein
MFIKSLLGFVFSVHLCVLVLAGGLVHDTVRIVGLSILISRHYTDEAQGATVQSCLEYSEGFTDFLKSKT